MIQRGASSAEVARLAGVSRTTVSFVLNNTPGKVIPEDTRKRVIEAARALDYQPDVNARRVAKATRRTVGLVIGHSGSAYSDAYILRLLEGIAPVLNKARCRLVMVPVRRNLPIDPAMALHYGLDGVLVTNLRHAEPDLGALALTKVPLVAIGVVADGSICQIDIDNHRAACQATAHLLEFGHRDLGMIIHAPLAYAAARTRLAGFREALAGAGITVPDSWIQVADFTEESGYRCMQYLLSQARSPTAVFAGNDAIAWGAMQAIQDANLHIPGDISLVGFDDDFPSRFLDPPLTSVTVPAASLGERAARMLLDLMSGTVPEVRQITVAVDLTVRESVRRLTTR